MKSILGILLAACLLGGGVLAVAPAADADSDGLGAVVDELEAAFLGKMESTSEPGKVCDDYEARLKEIIAEHPGRPEPFTGMLELFEKCEASRTRRLLDEFLARPDLPEKVRAAFGQTRKTLDLLGTPVGLTLRALDGSTVNFEKLRGKVVVLDFWATWCGPCVRDLPKLQAIYARHQADGLVVVGVSFDRERTKLDAFLKASALPWPQVYPDAAAKDAIARDLGVTGGYLPMVFLIGRDGLFRHTLDSRFRLAEKVAVLMKEQEGAKP